MTETPPSGHVPTEAELRAEIERLAAMLNEPFARCAVCNVALPHRRRGTVTCSGRCRTALYEQRKARPPGINADASLVLDRKTESDSVSVKAVSRSPGPGHSSGELVYTNPVQQWPECERSMILARLRPGWVQAPRPTSADEPPDWAEIAG
jgi:predicted nucleic acid-binding Zn ribbon protein